jgi:signal transduction histidine kinase
MSDDDREMALVATASRYLIDRGLYGLVWIDADLIVREHTGSLVESVKIGQPVTHSVLALFGLEDDMHAVRTGGRKALEISNVAVVSQGEVAPRLNFYLHWMEAVDRFLLIVARTTTQTELEAELENQSRRRVLAEAQIVEQAKEIARANAELTRANRELSEFAYVISHDLNAPLRALRYHAEDIISALGRGDAPAAAAFSGGIDRQTRRMSRMLSDLLAYARIGRADEAMEETDTRSLVEAVVGSLPRPAAFRIEISGDWPLAVTVSAALDLVLRNLIDNAIKHHDRPDGTVTVSAAVNGPRTLTVTVRDDGPGIPIEFQGAAFQPFRRLVDDESESGEGVDDTDDDVGGSDNHAQGALPARRQVVEGSGIGLALVRKSAESVGATLRLDSDPSRGRGATFILDWPISPVAS